MPRLKPWTTVFPSKFSRIINILLRCRTSAKVWNTVAPGLSQVVYLIPKLPLNRRLQRVYSFHKKLAWKWREMAQVTTVTNLCYKGIVHVRREKKIRTELLPKHLLRVLTKLSLSVKFFQRWNNFFYNHCTQKSWSLHSN